MSRNYAIREAVLVLTDAIDATGRLLFRDDLGQAEKQERAAEIARDIFGPDREPNPFYHQSVRMALRQEEG